MATQLHIPKLGDVFKLAEVWTTKIKQESRNDGFLKKLDEYSLLSKPRTITTSEYCYAKGDKYFLVDFPLGTELLLDRLYICQGFEAFDGVTFRIQNNPFNLPDKIGWGRFWIPLNDANRMVGEWLLV